MNEEYVSEIRKAADGEVQGEIIFKAFAEIAGAEHRHKLEVLAALEQRTGRELASLVERYGIELSGSNVEEGEAFARKYTGMTYREILEDWATWIPDYVQLYDRLADSARPADKKALEFLAAHERAIDRFIGFELAGKSDDALAELAPLLQE
jgi:rubrerythrin